MIRALFKAPRMVLLYLSIWASGNIIMGGLGRPAIYKRTQVVCPNTVVAKDAYDKLSDHEDGIITDSELQKHVNVECIDIWKHHGRDRVIPADPMFESNNRENMAIVARESTRRSPFELCLTSEWW